MKGKPEEVRRRGQDAVRDLIRTAERALVNATKELDSLRALTPQEPAQQGWSATCEYCDAKIHHKTGCPIHSPPAFSEAELLRRLRELPSWKWCGKDYFATSAYLSLARAFIAKGGTVDEVVASAEGGEHG